MECPLKEECNYGDSCTSFENCLSEQEANMNISEKRKSQKYNLFNYLVLFWHFKIPENKPNEMIKANNIFDKVGSYKTASGVRFTKL
jgi:hypothetical protein